MNFNTLKSFIGVFCLFIISCQNTATEQNQPDTTLETISLEDKIGQMLMIGFSGLELSDTNHIKKDIADLNIGGVVLYDHDQLSSGILPKNVASPAQLKKLCADLQGLNETSLLISIDQEGGRVSRLKEKYGFPKPAVSAQYLGTLNNIDSTTYWANETATLLQELGINFNYTPVVDLNVNPASPAIGAIERSFSADPAVVVQHAEAVINAHHNKGVVCSIKHFPGHGSAKVDSHLGITDVTETWSKIELEPYRQLIKNEVLDVVMTAHVYNAQLDTLPATLSKKIMTDLLRTELGWDGIIISDDMHMGAIVKHFGLEMAIEKTLEAGVDILMFSNNSKDFYDAGAASKAIQIIKRLIKEGKVTEERIDDSYQRIVALKETMTGF